MTYDQERITYFAETDARNKRERFGIKAKDRARHMYIIGKTGMGKSTLLENMAVQDIQNGEGLAFIDPHGSTAEKLLEYVPKDRVEDVIYFAPFDMDNPIAFNVMEDVGYDKRHLVVSGLMSAFKKIWVDAWSARMEYILSNTLLALLEYPDSTLLDVNRMLIDKAYRKKVVDHVSDPIVRSFWVDEFANYTDRYTQDATPAIQNKVGQFTSNPLVRNIVGQPQSTFDLRKIMDERKIFIANLSKGRIGETNADLLGSMLTTKIYLSAMSRADLPNNEQAKLPPFYFTVDEFQSIANESFADILSEARKYKLCLTLAHQYIEQMEETVRDAVFGNVGTTITFRVGPFDAETLETVFQPQFMATDLVNLGFAQIYLTLMIDSVGSKPFSAKTLPPIDPPHFSHVDQVIIHSKRTYGHPREEVEATIRGKSEELEKERLADHKARSAGGGGGSSGGDRPKTSRPPARSMQTGSPATVRSSGDDAHTGARQERTFGDDRDHARPTQQQSRPAQPASTRTDSSARGGSPRKEITMDELRTKVAEQARRESQKPKERPRADKGPSDESRSELRSALQGILGDQGQAQKEESRSPHQSQSPQGQQKRERRPRGEERPRQEERRERAPQAAHAPSQTNPAQARTDSRAPGGQPHEIPEAELKKILGVDER